MTSEMLCPICEEGRLYLECENLEAEYRGRTALLPSHFAVCEACGSETATAEQTRENKRGMIAFKKEVDGFLNGEEIVALRKKLSITQGQAAKIFGGGPVAFSKYEKDDVTQSESMDKLLRVAERFPMVAAWLAKESGEIGVSANLCAERFPIFEAKSFVQPELKASTERATVSRNQFQYLKLEKSTPSDEDILNVG